MMDCSPRKNTLLLVLLLTANWLHAQIGGLSFDLPKPKKFENRQLRSEKTGDKKFTIPRRFIQNTTTHYNFFFNANEKLEQVIDRAKDSHKDDFTRLLSFYNYSFDQTAQAKTELDSVIYKSTAGILLHDLRSNWVDNMYLLMGRAYFLKKDFDSAFLTFQYLNYAFSPKEKDGYDKIIGSNSNADEGGSAFSISTNEKTNIVKKAFSRRPSRNESLVWLVKTYIASDQLPEAASLIQTLKYDPLFPNRLQGDLNESQAWYFYQQQNWDSAAFYLEKALPNASGKQEMARWEYLIAQLYEASGKHTLAQTFYERVVKHTINPVMEVYAVLNSIRQGQGTDEKAIQEAIDALKKMARRDKYVFYRDIIYYTAAQIELDRSQPLAAKALLEKSIRTSENNPAQKSRSFLALANIEFDLKNYIDAKRFYDSTDASTIDPEDLASFNDRKNALGSIAAAQMVIKRQDSLQKIAALPEADRTALLKKLLRQLRKEQGLKEEEPSFGNTGNSFTGNEANAPAVDLFSTGNKSDWYFSNTTLKARGFSEFKAKWGNRPNADNWQRAAVIRQQQAQGRNQGSLATQLGNGNAQPEEFRPLSIDGLKEKLPLTAEKMKQSNDSILHAQFEIGKALQDNLEAYPDAISAYETLETRFPGSSVEEQTLFNLYYCYKKVGDTQKMNDTRRLLESKYSNSKSLAIIRNPVAADTARKQEGTPIYENIYNLFIEGKFDEALARKRAADSLYGKYYWSPQLLYIEAVYYIQQRNDSVAISVLNNINSLYAGTPMADKARSLADVLSRRKQIEEYLTNLKVEIPKEDSIVNAAPVGTPMEQGPVVARIPLKTDSSNLKQPASPAVRQPAKDSVQLAVKKPVTAPATGTSFVFAPEQPHFVALVMDKVDPVYVGEAKNAFNRYNREKYYNQTIEITPLQLTDDLRMMLMGNFANAIDALDYMEKAAKQAPGDIIPWMPATKYSFIIITAGNLEVLKNNKDLAAYHKFLVQNFKDKFK